MKREEAKLWQAFRREFAKAKRTHPILRSVHVYRVENSVNDGDPDVNFIVDSCTIFIELKAPNKPKRKTTRLLGGQGLRLSQKNWALKAVQAGIGNSVYTLIRSVGQERLYFVSAFHSEAINEMTACELAELSKASTWEELFLLLSNPRTLV